MLQLVELSLMTLRVWCIAVVELSLMTLNFGVFMSEVEKLTRSSLQGPFYKNGCFASSFLLLGVGLL